VFGDVLADVTDVRRPASDPLPSGSGDGVWEVTSHADEWRGVLPGELPPVGGTFLLGEEFERDRALPGGTEVAVVVPPGVRTLRSPGGSLRLPAGTRVLVEGVRFDVGSRVGELVVLPPDAAPGSAR
jgi:hypothetical protein